MEKKKCGGFLVIIQLLHTLINTNSQSFIGVNYGEVADNLPSPAATAKLLQSTSISKLRLYNVNTAMIQALAHTGISIVIGTTNADIPTLASSPSFASQWLSANILPFLPSSAISVISIGNEFLNFGDPSLYSQLLPAMKNLQAALPPNSNIKVSTVHAMAVLAQSDPPSSGAFHADLAPVLTSILGFLSQTKSPFMINPYPYFAYRDDPRPETLAYCLFQPNPGRVDAGSKITYMNMFDAQVDAVRSAVNAAGFPGVEIVVAETGWPYNGDTSEAGATVENAKAFTAGLVNHLRTLVGTPLMPGKSVDTYIFELYDEDLKGGAMSERSFGLYRADQMPIFDAGLSKSSSQMVTNATAPSPSPYQIPPKADAPVQPPQSPAVQPPQSPAVRPPQSPAAKQQQSPAVQSPQSPAAQQQQSPTNLSRPGSSSTATWNVELSISHLSICIIYLLAF
ncbi:putative glucan endo-1,3-beta-glucosidase 7 [Iris pallida]|uniref:glucan endo-1,3-beta-D-glucosidase n=1 Tax=Iris pallida TaxID=29817 RepID=A0AAX6DW05_IRIPA|nr:putative glucan endo-1,3-beta-glucosidase 7 [Iris pallida]